MLDKFKENLLLAPEIFKANENSLPKILVLFGTRPEAIKVASVIYELKKSAYFQTVVVSSSQHTDLLMPFLKIFNLETNYDLRVMTANQTPNQVCSKVLSALDAILEEEKPDAILMQGDTTTAFTGAFAAFNRKIVYPKNGISTLCEKLAEGLADKIKLETPVEEILVENEKVFAVKAKGETQKVSAVVSTAPANILVKLVKGTNKLENFKAFRYRPMIFVNMRFEGRGLLPDTVLWFPEREFPFFRLTEATISIPWLAPEGKTIITVDIGCEKDDEFWTMDEEKLSALCLEHLTKIIPGAREKYLGAAVLKTPIAYPVFLNEYETARKDFEQSTGVENLLSIGRNGEFAHIFMEDVYWRTRRKIRNLIETQ